jgi:hypothetical protein
LVPLRSYSEAAFGHESPQLILSQQCLGLAIIPYISATYWACISGSTIILTGWDKSTGLNPLNIYINTYGYLWVIYILGPPWFHLIPSCFQWRVMSSGEIRYDPAAAVNDRGSVGNCWQHNMGLSWFAWK